MAICFGFSTVAFFLLSLAFMGQVFGIKESDLFPHDESTGSTRFRFGDDGTVNVPLSSPFTLFNKTHSSVLISGNGMLGFGPSNMSFGASPSCGPTTQDVQWIMGFWSDAIERNESELLYMETTTDDALLQKAKKDITAAFSIFNRRPLNLSWMFIVTWKNIYRYGSNVTIDFEKNTYQVVLAKSESHSFVLFYYVKLEWSQAMYWAGGFDFGNSRPMYLLPGSCTADFQIVANTSNIGKGSKGKWIFEVESDLRLPGMRLPTDSDYTADEETLLMVRPRVVSVMGNVPIIIHGLYLEKDEILNIACAFHDPSRPQQSESIGVVITQKDKELFIACPVPFLYSLGRIPINLLVQLKHSVTTVIYKGHIYAVKEHDLEILPQMHVDTSQETSMLSVSWNQSSVSLDDIKILDGQNGSFQIGHDSVEIVLLEYKRNIWKELGPVTPPIPNTGTFSFPLNMAVLQFSRGTPCLHTFAIKCKFQLESGATIQKLMMSNTLMATDMITSLMQTFDTDTRGNVTENVYDRFCKTWYEMEPHPPNKLDTLPCPRTVEQAQNDWRYVPEGVSASELKILNPGASSSFIQKVPSRSGAGSHCTYDHHGRLLFSIPGAGRLHRHSPNNRKDYWAHYTQDILPYLYCCRWSKFKESNCVSYYYNKRPLSSGSDYLFPQPACATGLSHITTFDGSYSTIAGGEQFDFIRYANTESDHDTFSNPDHHTDEFSLQIKMKNLYIQQSNGKFENASIINGIVIEDIGYDKEMKVEVQLTPSHNDISVKLDDRRIDENGQEDHTNFNFYHDGLIISVQSKTQLILSFSSGFSIMIMSSGSEHGSLHLVATAPHQVVEEIKDPFRGYEGLKKSISRLSSNNTTLDPPLTTDPTYNGDVSEQLCADFEQCKYDYHMINNSLLAQTGMKTYGIYQNILRLANLIVKQCELPHSLQNGYFNVSSLVVDSTITASCNFGYVLQPEETGESFICQNVNSSSLKEGATWENIVSNASISALSCVHENLNQDVMEVVEYDSTTLLTDEMIVTETPNVSMESSHDREDYTKSESYSNLSEDKLLALFIYILISAIAVAIFTNLVVLVIISKCRGCERLRMYFIGRVCLIREDNVELSEL